MAVGTGPGGGLPFIAVAAGFLIAAYGTWRFGGVYLSSRVIIDRWKHPVVFWGSVVTLTGLGLIFLALGIRFPHP
jgi:hypothetical protein